MASIDIISNQPDNNYSKKYINIFIKKFFHFHKLSISIGFH